MNKITLFASHSGLDDGYERIEVHSPEAAGAMLARLLRNGWEYVQVDHVGLLAVRANG